VDRQLQPADSNAHVGHCSNMVLYTYTGSVAKRCLCKCIILRLKDSDFSLQQLHIKQPLNLDSDANNKCQLAIMR